MGDRDTSRPHALLTRRVGGRTLVVVAGRTRMGRTVAWSSRSVRWPRAHRLLRGNVERRQRLRPSLPGLRVDSKWLSTTGALRRVVPKLDVGRARAYYGRARARMVFAASFPLSGRRRFFVPCPAGLYARAGGLVDGRQRPFAHPIVLLWATAARPLVVGGHEEGRHMDDGPRRQSWIASIRRGHPVSEPGRA